MPPETDATSIIVEAFEPLAGKRLLDIGCGSGALARLLSDRGAHVGGVDPNAQALALAREAVPGGTFHVAGAESLPFADDSFDGAVFLNSFHHVPKPAMRQALHEAARVVEPAGPIVVVEPLAEGSFFFALRPVEDETEVRTAAQYALRQAVESGAFEQQRRVDYLRRELFEGLEQFLARVVAVDPARAPVVAENRPEIEAAFRLHARVADGRTTLEQPMRAHVLRPKT
ncbi:methyltransferase domain-containing protein [Rubrobacter tropicus]|uniref:Methyltransferase domain-containing protein n=1 Tax=Rubrobacter tropicus TaxID=2653851 RepID=A0A6G8Q6C8_9ACTN|nr:class I SAM-dependent methyltransferase [Rubrobacter tropicus]QIN81877.1 methyltransferase domain-containing protein [Rubrobacter tropicus]